jgi:hypothetical protein
MKAPDEKHQPIDVFDRAEGCYRLDASMLQVDVQSGARPELEFVITAQFQLRHPVFCIHHWTIHPVRGAGNSDISEFEGLLPRLVVRATMDGVHLADSSVNVGVESSGVVVVHLLQIVPQGQHNVVITLAPTQM